jgi:exosortase
MSAETTTSPLPPAAEPSWRKQAPIPELLWFGALLLWNYWHVLRKLAANWQVNEDMGHGFFVPVVAAYIIWTQREELTPVKRPAWWGLGFVAWGALQLYAATLGVELFLARVAFLLSLAGVVLVLAGWENFLRLRFPLFLLVFMIPLPAIIYSQITFPLQIFASQTAAALLSLMGIPVLRDGNILELPSQKLSVVEACSGIRWLVSLTFLALVYGHFFDSRAWMKWVLVVLVVPIAVLVNALRVTGTGVLSEIDPALAEGFFHQVEGWIVFAVALGLLVFTHWLVSAFTRRFKK